MIVAHSGISVEQKVVTVNNVDATINAEISLQADSNWLVTSLTLSGSNIIILFTKTIAAS